MTDPIERLQQAVSWREYIVRLVTRFQQSLLVAALLAVMLVVASRVTGFVQSWLSWPVLAAVPFVAIAAAALLVRRPRSLETARLIDEAAQAQDLFVTVAQLSTSAGEYQPVVRQAAERAAVRLAPAQIRPMPLERGWWPAVAMGVCLGLVWWFLPQWDPFGKIAQARTLDVRQQRLSELKKQTEARKLELKQQVERQPKETPADKAVEDLKQAFNEMKPQQQAANQQRLQSEQRKVAEVRKDVVDKSLREFMSKKSDESQQFGKTDSELMRKVKEELKQGRTDSLKQEVAELQKELERLSKTTDPVQKQQQQEQIKKRLEQLEELAKKELSSPELASALQRAAKQMDLSQQGQLSANALQAAAESLELSQDELARMADALEDLQQLEEALKSLQMAKSLNKFEKLDGGQCKGCKSVKDYAEKFADALSQCRGNGDGKPGDKRGKGKGMGGPGQGEGGEAPEDDSIETTTKSEKSPVSLQAGKTLLTIKTRGEGESGPVNQDYSNLIDQVRQGAAEALATEQIPPGYVDDIKRYFDTLPAEPEPASGPADAPVVPEPAASDEPVTSEAPAADAAAP